MFGSSSRWSCFCDVYFKHNGFRSDAISAGRRRLCDFIRSVGIDFRNNLLFSELHVEENEPRWNQKHFFFYFYFSMEPDQAPVWAPLFKMSFIMWIKC